MGGIRQHRVLFCRGPLSFSSSLISFGKENSRVFSAFSVTSCFGALRGRNSDRDRDRAESAHFFFRIITADSLNSRTLIADFKLPERCHEQLCKSHASVLTIRRDEWTLRTRWNDALVTNYLSFVYNENSFRCFSVGTCRSIFQVKGYLCQFDCRGSFCTVRSSILFFFLIHVGKMLVQRSFNKYMDELRFFQSVIRKNVCNI